LHLKIIRIIARLNVGGPARHVVWLTAGLRQKHDTLLVAGTVPHEEDDMGYFAEENGVVPYFIPEMSREISLKDAVTIWKLFRLFRRERPDIVHTHTAKAGTAGRLAGFAYRWLTLSTLVGRPRRCRFVHTYHGHVFHSYYGTLKTRFFLAIEKVLARIVTDRIIVISPQQFQEINGLFHVGRSDQFSVVPLGLELGMFDRSGDRRGRLRQELGVADDEILVGIVGRLTEVKNHRLFLEAAAKLKKTSSVSSSRVRFVVIGDGNLREALIGHTAALGLDDDVYFLGLRIDPENFYPGLDIVALTSFNEGTPLTLIEAMANGRACIATAVGGVTDLFGQRRSGGEGSGYRLCERGILVDSGDVDAMCSGFTRLIDDIDLRRDLGARGSLYVRQGFSRDRLLSDIESLYDELVHAKVRTAAEFSPVKSDSQSSDLLV
jgi:glycosyltransferase involved in cell wall biosynthesis